MKLKIEKSVTKLFKATEKIKKLQSNNNITVILDKSNKLYIVKEITQITRTIQEVQPELKIEDFAIINDHILAVSSKTLRLLHVNFNGEFHFFTKKLFSKQSFDQNKATGFKKIVYNENIYLMGDKLFVLNSDYELLYVINDNITDFAIMDGDVVVLTASKEVVKYRKAVAVSKKVFNDNFGFTSIYCTRDFVFVAAVFGVKILSKSLEFVTLYKTGFEVERVSVVSGVVLVMGKNVDQVRGLENNTFKGIVNFPRSGVHFPRITSFCENNEALFYAHNVYVSTLSLK